MSAPWPVVSQTSLAAFAHVQDEEDIYRTSINDNPIFGPFQEQELLLEHRLPERRSEEWNRLGKLVLLSALSSIGTMGNIFAISAVMSEKQLKKRGNLLLVNLMLASLLITVGVLPADVVVLLAGWKRPSPLCSASWFLTSLAAHTSLITLPCMAVENYFRLVRRSMSLAVLVVLVVLCWTISMSLVCGQWLGGLGPSHCETNHSTNVYTHKMFTGTVGVILVLTPLAIAIAVHARTLLAAHTNIRPPRRGASSSIDPKVPIITSRDLALPATNLAVSAFAGSCWVVGIASDWWAEDQRLGSLMWFPFGSATVTGFLYAAHKPFRESYIQLFHYCCCKTSVSLNHRGRNDNNYNLPTPVLVPNNASSRPSSDVRVHIIPGYNMYTPASTRDHRAVPHRPARPKENRRQKQSHKKDVYEL